jgi:site-specific DNA-methyltransferase (adenine-specific)
MKPEKNKLYLEDCLTEMSKWDDNCIDHCIVDPPFNISKEKGLGWAFSSHVTMSADWDIFPREEYLEFSKKWIEEVSRVVKENGNIFIFGTYHNIYDLGNIVNNMGLRVINSIVWFKPNAQPNISARMLTESTEHIIWICNNSKEKATKWTFNYEIAKKFNKGKQLRNVWAMPYTPKREKKYGKHPSQKPLDLITRLIYIGTNEEEIILDCFSGTGTLGVVAQSFNRNWVMIENNTDYYEISKKRLKFEKVPVPNEILQIRMEL